MASDARVRVAENVGLPFPARRVRMSRSNVLGLEPLELLLGAELVGLRSNALLAFHVRDGSREVNVPLFQNFSRADSTRVYGVKRSGATCGTKFAR